MRIRALKTTTGMPRGSVAEVDDYTARELISQGYAIEELPVSEQEAAPANDNRPLELTGGQTGADVPQSSSPEVQAQKTLVSSEQSAPTASESSRSTTDTDSPHGPTSSTPATTTGGRRKRGRSRSKD